MATTAPSCRQGPPWSTRPLAIRAAPVTRGARLASFFWIQSMVRDDGQRSLLFDLSYCHQPAAGELPADHASPVALTAVYHNLLRRWADA